MRHISNISKETAHRFSDEELLQMVNLDYSAYNEEELEIARGELTRRGKGLLFTKPRPPAHRYWFVEVWEEDRELFKELVKHIIRYSLLMISLFLTKHLVDHLDYPEDLKHPFEVIHYYGILIIVLLFTFFFILKILAFEVRRRRG